MYSGDILLVQGPPGSGKTSSITSMMAMILYTNPKAKIHVCAPSNAAVDEILARIGEKGLIGFENKDLTQMLLRIGALEHNFDPAIKKFSLDEKIGILAQKEYKSLIEKAYNLITHINTFIFEEQKAENLKG